MTERPQEQDQEELDVAAGPAHTGRTAADALTEEGSPGGGNVAGAMGSAVSTGETLSRGGGPTAAGPGAPSTGTGGRTSSDDDDAGDPSAT